jgi:poly(3-hydroxybutyrate) depolymerase
MLPTEKYLIVRFFCSACSGDGMNFRKSMAVRTIAIVSSLLFLFLISSSPAQETKETVTVDDVDRAFIVRLPQGYDKEKKYPVVILLHGMNQHADDMQRLTGFDEAADKNGVITVYPSALHGRWNIGVQPPQDQPMMRYPGRRRGYGGGYPGGGYPGGGGGYPGGGGGYPGGGGGYPGGGGGYPNGGQSGGQNPNDDDQARRRGPVDDVEFLNQMLDQMTSKFSIDTSRIYATGLSEGGFMAMRVGCAMSDRIAAIGPVGADMPKTMVCLPSHPVPVVMINGTSDPIVPYDGGNEHNLHLKVISAEDSAQAWARIDHCNEKPSQTKLPAKEKGGLETKVQTYEGCQQDAPVTLYSIKGGGNTWPGGEQYEVEKEIGKTSRDLNANETIWNFFSTKKLAAKLPADKDQAKQ